MPRSDAQPLSDLSVVELSTMIAGPYAGQLLGDLGADVVKLERPGNGELARHLEPTVGGESFYYLTANRNKRSLAVDVTTDEGRDVFFDLVERADVVLENFPPTFAERYGIDYDAARERNPGIIYCSISAYGETGPYRESPGIDTTIQAVTGAMSTTRDEGTPPMRSGVPMNDAFAALHAVGSVLAAVHQRDRADEWAGEHIDVSLLDVGVAGLTTRAMYSLVAGEPYPPFGRRHNYFAPEGVFAVADGDLQLSVVTDRQWRRFCEVLDAPGLAADGRFETTNDRVRNRAELERELAEKLEAWEVDPLVEALRAAGIPAGRINDTVSVWEHPQVEARDMRRTLSHPTAGEIDTLGFPVKYRYIRPSIDRHPPLLGEHTEELLREHGYGDDDIASLREDGVIDVGDR